MGSLTIRRKEIGQVPGEVYTLQCLDGKGKPLPCVFIFIDAEGTKITVFYDSDENGLFHVTMPDHNAENIFLQVSSYENYEIKVIPIIDAINAGFITLQEKNKSKGISLEAGLSMVGIALAVASMAGKKRSVSGVKDKAKQIIQQPIVWYGKQDNTTKLLLIGGAAVAVYFALKYKPTKEQTEYLNAAKDELNRLATQEGIYPSLLKTQYASMALQIRKALDKCGTEEGVIYNQFNLLNNEADIYKLILACGIMKYDGCFEGELPSWNVHYTLAESLASDLTYGEIDDVNDILKQKGIIYRF